MSGVGVFLTFHPPLHVPDGIRGNTSIAEACHGAVSWRPLLVSLKMSASCIHKAPRVAFFMDSAFSVVHNTSSEKSLSSLCWEGWSIPVVEVPGPGSPFLN